MAEKILNTRLQLKYDTLVNWSKTETAGQGANLILKAGELGICYVPAVSNGISTTAPTVLFKVGDGTTAYSALPWASGLAADVYEWAKANAKPSYNAGEISDTDAKVLMTAIERTKLAGIAEGANNYTLPVAGDNLGGVKSGTDITVDASGNVSVNDDSHNHVISNIDGLQDTLDSKATAAQGALADAAMPKAGGTFTGAITLNGAPTADLHAATKKYVDDSVAGLSGAMHFEGKFDALPAVASYEAGDVVIVGNKEYVLLDNNGTKSWIELGDESIYVEKQTGKGLSTNDYTTEEKNKLAAISTEAKKVEASTTNGNVKIDGTETTVYSHPTTTAVSAAAKKVGHDELGHVVLGSALTASDVGAATSTDITNAINALDVSDISGFGAGKTLKTLAETDGKISATFQDISITSSQISDKTDSYSATGTAAVTGKAIAAAIGELDVSNISGFGAGKTLSALAETNGKISASFQDISITSSQISDIASTYSSTGTVAVNGKAIAAAINGLDVSDISGFSAGKTLSALSETDGKISASFQDIAINQSQINQGDGDVLIFNCGSSISLV